ncbi:MAG: EAL domain-containing protein [Glaciimonas sp.]|nr:EAL domain-containing protein [Glaciimonas sp.]
MTQASEIGEADIIRCNLMLAIGETNIAENQRSEQWQQHYTQTLDLLAADAPLATVLEGFAVFVERQCGEALCSIHLLSSDGKRLICSAAPSLPEFYSSINGIELGEGVESCGTAAFVAFFTGGAGTVEDALTHPYWVCQRELAIRAGLHACWCEPILSVGGKVLGTFALNYRKPRTPTPDEIACIRREARFAALVIDRTQQQENLRLAAVVFEQGIAAVVITDARQHILSVNRAFTQMTGYPPEEVIGQTTRILQSGRHDTAFYRTMWESIQETGGWQGDAWERKKTGECYPKWLSISAVRDGQGKITHYVSSSVDITEQKAHVAHIEQLAFYDSLTGLPNRALFMDRLKQSLAVAQRHEQRVAILFMDINRFKEINDTQGHNVGDQVLIEVARCFQAITRGEETLARLGGDEFGVTAAGADQAAATLIAERLQQALVEPITVKGQTFTLGMSIGIAVYPEDGATTEDLLKRADIAMYRAKESGGGYRFYQPEMSAGLADRMTIARNLSRALNAGALELYYQPQVTLQTGAMIGAEALLRWNDPECGRVGPAQFIPIAEERGMMSELGKWVLQEACRQMKAWQDSGLHFPGRLAINLAAQQLEDADIADNIQEIVRAAGLTPACLELELTESGLMGNVERTIKIMQTLKTAGFALSIDDFGTGYSSLSYLKRLPADTLKIDISFVRDMLKGRHDYTIVTTIIGMARNLGLKTIAEGVEELEQAEALLALGCDEAQGYYFGHPEPAHVFAQKWLGTAPNGLCLT